MGGKVIDAIGIDAQHAHGGPDEPGLLGPAKQTIEQYVVEPTTRKVGSHFVFGDAPNQVLGWAVEYVAKAGTIAIIGAKALKLDDDVAKLEAAVADMQGGDDIISELAVSAMNAEAVEG